MATRITNAAACAGVAAIGTLLNGGRVSVAGTFLGGSLVTVLSAGLLLMQVGEFWVKAVLGLLLLLAVFSDKARRFYLAKRKMA
jgi:ribose transport system permease protein